MRPEEYNTMVEKLAEEICENVFEKEAMNRYKKEAYSGNLGAESIKKIRGAGLPLDLTKTKIKKPEEAAKNGILKFVKDHPKMVGIGGAGLAATGLTAAGLAAYKNKKKKEEEQKEKVAAYYEDALLAKQAAEEAWALADQYEDSAAVSFIKQAAEEAYENAEAYAEAAKNVFDAIENDEI